jgi:hypothetical protein
MCDWSLRWDYDVLCSCYTRSMKMFGKISIDRDVLNGDQTRSHERRKTDICSRLSS